MFYTVYWKSAILSLALLNNVIVTLYIEWLYLFWYVWKEVTQDLRGNPKRRVSPGPDQNRSVIGEIFKNISGQVRSGNLISGRSRSGIFSGAWDFFFQEFRG